MLAAIVPRLHYEKLNAITMGRSFRLLFSNTSWVAKTSIFYPNPGTPCLESNKYSNNSLINRLFMVNVSWLMAQKSPARALGPPRRNEPFIIVSWMNYSIIYYWFELSITRLMPQSPPGVVADARSVLFVKKRPTCTPFPGHFKSFCKTSKIWNTN